jgi:hypothetical protein
MIHTYTHDEQPDPEGPGMKRRRKMITVTNHTEYHHLPQGAEYADLYGMTLRQALRILRQETWGNLGGTFRMDLSDGTYMSVELTPTGEGASRLMSSQRCVRRECDRGRERQVAVYPIV